MAPRPGAHTNLRGKSLQVAAARVATPKTASPPGTVNIEFNRIVVSAVGGAVEIVRAKLEGRKELPATDLINGRVLASGDVLGAPSANGA
jgi:methionyl-tRNA formyltransferase